MINTKKFSTTEKRTKKSVFSDSFGVCFLLIFIILLIYSGEYLSNPNILPIKYIKVEGKLSRLSQTELKDTVENNIRGGFFHLNANEVRLALLDIPWVREVSIKRISLFGEDIYFNLIIASISTTIPNGKELEPTATLECRPCSPKISIRMSEAPLIIFGWSVKLS